jgi:hypothetical protein
MFPGFMVNIPCRNQAEWDRTARLEFHLVLWLYCMPLALMALFMGGMLIWDMCK